MKISENNYKCERNMERKLQIEKDDFCCAEKMRDPYKKALENNWRGFKEFYDSHPNDLFSPLTVDRENAIHFAATSKKAQLVRNLLEKLPDQSEKLKAITTTDVHGNTPLHEVATTNCVEAAKPMVDILLNITRSESDNDEEKTPLMPKNLKKDPKKLLVRNNLGESPLYRAAAYGKTKMVQYLVKQIDPNVLHEHFIREDAISILHIAITGQHFDTAICLLKIEEELIERSEYYRNEGPRLAKREEENGMTCFNLVALMPLVFKSGRLPSKLKEFVYSWLPPAVLSQEQHMETGKNFNNVRQTMNNQTGLLKRKEEYEHPISSQGQDLESGNNNNEIRQPKNRTVSNKWIALLMSIWIAIWRWLIEACPAVKEICKEKRNDKSALELVQLLVEQDTSWQESHVAKKELTISLGLDKGEGKATYPTEISPDQEKSKNLSTEVSDACKKRSSTEAPLVMAASNGIVEIIEAILEKYPQAVDYVSDDGQNMLHAAIKFRRKEIFDLIKNKEEKIWRRLGTRIDNNGYTLLHHVADMKYYRGGTRFGPALQFQEELEWFENVKELIPPHYNMHRNNKRITAKDLFDVQHKEQLKDAQQWMKDTSESFSTVSILVATVVFAAAYTVPGGNNDNGIPVFLYAPLFWVFTIMDVVSLICSLSSVAMFLSILTSPFKPEAFLKSLPGKMMIAFGLLGFSVLSSMITFATALLLLIRLEKRWTTFLVYVTVFIPVVVFAWMQFPLYSAPLNSFFNKFKCTPRKKKKKEERDEI